MFFLWFLFFVVQVASISAAQPVPPVQSQFSRVFKDDKAAQEAVLQLDSLLTQAVDTLASVEQLPLEKQRSIRLKVIPQLRLILEQVALFKRNYSPQVYSASIEQDVLLNKYLLNLDVHCFTLFEKRINQLMQESRVYVLCKNLFDLRSFWRASVLVSQQWDSEMFELRNKITSLVTYLTNQLDVSANQGKGLVAKLFNQYVVQRGRAMLWYPYDQVASEDLRKYLASHVKAVPKRLEAIGKHISSLQDVIVPKDLMHRYGHNEMLYYAQVTKMYSKIQGIYEKMGFDGRSGPVRMRKHFLNPLQEIVKEIDSLNYNVLQIADKDARFYFSSLGDDKELQVALMHRRKLPKVNPESRELYGSLVAVGQRFSSYLEVRNEQQLQQQQSPEVHAAEQQPIPQSQPFYHGVVARAVGINPASMQDVIDKVRGGVGEIRDEIGVISNGLHQAGQHIDAAKDVITGQIRETLRDKKSWLLPNFIRFSQDIAMVPGDSAVRSILKARVDSAFNAGTLAGPGRECRQMVRQRDKTDSERKLEMSDDACEGEIKHQLDMKHSRQYVEFDNKRTSEQCDVKQDDAQLYSSVMKVSWDGWERILSSNFAQQKPSSLLLYENIWNIHRRIIRSPSKDMLTNFSLLLPEIMVAQSYADLLNKDQKKVKQQHYLLSAQNKLAALPSYQTAAAPRWQLWCGAFMRLFGYETRTMRMHREEAQRFRRTKNDWETIVEEHQKNYSMAQQEYNASFQLHKTILTAARSLHRPNDPKVSSRAFLEAHFPHLHPEHYKAVFGHN